MIEITDTSEYRLKARRRNYINWGYTVSLMSYDPSRDIYVFDIYPKEDGSV